LLATVRILAWPLTDWPLIGLREAFLVAGTVALSIVLGLIWRVVVIRRELAAHREPASQREPADQPEAVRTFATEPGSQATDDGDIRAGDDPSLADRRDGLALVGVGLFVLIVVPGLLLRNVAEVQELPTEQYHAYADPLALIAAGLVLGGLWQTRRAWRGVRLGRLVVTAALAGLVAWNATRLPPLTAPDGGWPAAHAAAQRLEADARGGAIAFVALPAIKGADAYIYPLTYDGATLTTPGGAATVVVLCDSFWVETGCGDSAAEAGWLVEASAGQGLTLVERFSPAPYRTLSVYRRTP
jgi:hypothetical protein